MFSPCGTWRYRLERGIGLDLGRTLGVIMVNSSRAAIETDDPTVYRVSGIAERLDYTRLIVGNLFGFITPYIRQLGTASDPIGPDNDIHLMRIIAECDDVAVAWGPTGKLPQGMRERWRVVQAMADAQGKPLSCFGVCADGHPRHPLLLPYTSTLSPWIAPGEMRVAA